jgi:hypothetical protein
LSESKGYYDLFFNPNLHELIVRDGTALVTMTVDINRITTVFEKLAYGLYFHHFKDKFSGNVRIEHLSLISIYGQYHPLLKQIAQIRNSMREICINKPKLGSNPDIFYYQIAHEGMKSHNIMRMVFYNGFEAYGLFDGS